jgi:hypothetical protein
MRLRAFSVEVLMVCVALLVPAVAAAQGEGASIVGQVQDASGALIPGVTVETSSPVLIEKMRTAVTDAAGRYAIINLRPGSYVVTFSLTGFSTVRREGIVLEGAFAAQVNAQLSVGALEETVTVSGTSPVVDVQNTRTQFVANRQILDVLPSRTTEDQAALVPGVVSYHSTPGQLMPDLYTQRMGAHGSDTNDRHIYFDGMNVNQMLLGGGGQSSANGVNELAQTELVYNVGSQSAESADGGIQMSVIPKEGGNVFSGVWRAFGGTGALQSDNLTPELRRVITAVNKLDYNWEHNVAVGGPIEQDRLWWFAALKLSQNNILAANTFFPDGRQADSGGHVAHNGNVRLTYQITPRNKLAVNYYNASMLTERYDLGGGGSGGLNIQPEAAYRLASPLNYSALAKWTAPVTSRLLLEVGQSLSATTYQFLYQLDNGPFAVQHFNASTGVRTMATMNPIGYFDRLFNTVANMSYVTGSHTFKTGVNFQSGFDRRHIVQRGDIAALTFVNVNGIPTPNSVSVRNSPLTNYDNLNANVGIFAQDRWTRQRFTFTFGGRFDYINASVPEQTALPGRFVPAREAAAVACLPCWKDWAVRFGVAYDVFGTGKTALKGTFGKFVASQALGLAGSVNPLALQTDPRNWRDLDGNGSALDGNGNAQYEEIGVSRNANFGLPVGATRFDQDSPWPTNWQESIGIEQELWRGVSVAGTYFHRDYQNISLTRNLLVDPDLDYTPFTITAPQNSSLPGGGGEVITMYNLNPSKLGALDSVFTWSNQNTRVYNGFELSVNARLPNGGFAFGGITTERTATNNCDVTNSNPNNRRFCEQVMPFQTLYKASAGYELPYAVQLSASFQARPGLSYQANYTFNSAIAGVPLTGGGNLTVNLVDPTTHFHDYVTQLDLRAARTFRFGRRRAQVFVDIFNLPNASTVLTANYAFGPQWLQPQSIMQGRRLQFGGRFDF